METADYSQRQKCYALCAKVNPIRTRFVMVIMACLAAVNAYLMRQCLGPTLTQLVLPRNYSIEEMKKHAVCKADDDFHTGMANKGTYPWDQKLQSLILSSFYIGYLITHVPGGYLADKFGSKWVLIFGLGMTGLFTIITPFVIEMGGATGLIIFRVIMGCCEGPTYPALSVLLADWVPKKERGLLGALVLSGGQLGTIISNSMTGVMLERHHWHMVFYIWGGVGLLWCFFFAILGYSSPIKHPCITDRERQYLLEEIGDNSAKRRDLPPTPFKAIFSSCAVWSLVAAQFGHNWAFFIIVTFLPKYMNDVLQVSIKKNGFLSALPSLCMWICSLITGVVADALINKGIMKVTPVRKLMTGIASFGPAIFMVAASYSGCNQVAVIVNFCICMALMGTYYGGMKLTPIDMSPNYAGFVMAVVNGLGAIIAFIAPNVVGYMTPHTTLEEWRLVFWVAFVVLVVTGLIYILWAKSDVQPWNDPKPKEKE